MNYTYNLEQNLSWNKTFFNDSHIKNINTSNVTNVYFTTVENGKRFVKGTSKSRTGNDNVVISHSSSFTKHNSYTKRHKKKTAKIIVVRKKKLKKNGRDSQLPKLDNVHRPKSVSNRTSQNVQLNTETQTMMESGHYPFESPLTYLPRYPVYVNVPYNLIMNHPEGHALWPPSNIHCPEYYSEKNNNVNLTSNTKLFNSLEQNKQSFNSNQKKFYYYMKHIREKLRNEILVPPTSCKRNRLYKRIFGKKTRSCDNFTNSSPKKNCLTCISEQINKHGSRNYCEKHSDDSNNLKTSNEILIENLLSCDFNSDNKQSINKTDRRESRNFAKSKRTENEISFNANFKKYQTNSRFTSGCSVVNRCQKCGCINDGVNQCTLKELRRKQMKKSRQSRKNNSCANKIFLENFMTKTKNINDNEYFCIAKEIMLKQMNKNTKKATSDKLFSCSKESLQETDELLRQKYKDFKKRFIAHNVSSENKFLRPMASKSCNTECILQNNFFSDLESRLLIKDNICKESNKDTNTASCEQSKEDTSVDSFSYSDLLLERNNRAFYPAKTKECHKKEANSLFCPEVIVLRQDCTKSVQKDDPIEKSTSCSWILMKVCKETQIEATDNKSTQWSLDDESPLRTKIYSDVHDDLNYLKRPMQQSFSGSTRNIQGYNDEFYTDDPISNGLNYRDRNLSREQYLRDFLNKNKYNSRSGRLVQNEFLSKNPTVKCSKVSLKKLFRKRNNNSNKRLLTNENDKEQPPEPPNVIILEPDKNLEVEEPNEGMKVLLRLKEPDLHKRKRRRRRCRCSKAVQCEKQVCVNQCRPQTRYISPCFILWSLIQRCVGNNSARYNYLNVCSESSSCSCSSSSCSCYSSSPSDSDGCKCRAEGVLELDPDAFKRLRLKQCLSDNCNCKGFNERCITNTGSRKRVIDTDDKGMHQFKVTLLPVNTESCPHGRKKIKKRGLSTADMLLKSKLSALDRAGYSNTLISNDLEINADFSSTIPEVSSYLTLTTTYNEKEKYAERALSISRPYGRRNVLKNSIILSEKAEELTTGVQTLTEDSFKEKRSSIDNYTNAMTFSPRKYKRRRRMAFVPRKYFTQIKRFCKTISRQNEPKDRLNVDAFKQEVDVLPKPYPEYNQNFEYFDMN